MKDTSKNPEFNNWKLEAGDEFEMVYDSPREYHQVVTLSSQKEKRVYALTVKKDTLT